VSGRDEWRWTDEQGVQRLVRTEELRAALASSVLPPSTLVWREGMSEWAPACDMPEFAAAASGARPPRPPAASSGDRHTPTDIINDVLRPPAGGAGAGAERPRMQTLVGMPSGEEEGRATEPHAAPIVVPAAAGASPTESRGVITQLPRFGGEQPDRPSNLEIPRAPRMPSQEPPRPQVRTQMGLGPAAAAARRMGTSDIDALWSGGQSRSDVPRHKDGDPPQRTRTDQTATLVRKPGGAPPKASDAKARVAGTEDAIELDSNLLDEAVEQARPRAPKHPSRPPPPLPPKRQPSIPPRDDAAAARSPSGRPPPKRSGPPPPLPHKRPHSIPPGANLPRPGTAAGGTPLPSAPPRTGPPARVASGAPPRPPWRDSSGDLAARSGAPPPAKRPGSPAATGKPLADANKPALEASTTSTARAPEAAPGSMSAPPALVAKLQSPSSSMTATAPPTMTGEASTGGSTAKMPAVVDPASSSWITQTTVDEPAGKGQDKTAAAKPTATAKPAAKDDAANTAGASARPGADAPKKPQPPTRTPQVTPLGLGPKGGDASPPFAAALDAADTSGKAAKEAPTKDAPKEPTAEAPSKPSKDAPLDKGPPPKDDVRVGKDRRAAESADAVSAAVPVRDRRVNTRDRRRPDSGAQAAVTGMPRDLAIHQQVQVPFSSLLFAAGTLIVMVVSSFLVGRCSMSPNVAQRRAVRSLRVLPFLARAATPSSKPCWVARQPVMWAPNASRSIPFELVPTDRGTLAMGYARAPKEAVGVDVNPATGEVSERFTDLAVAHEIERVSPAQTGDVFAISTANPDAPLHQIVHVPVDKPYVLGVAGDALAIADTPTSPPKPLWPGSGEGAKQLRVQLAGDRGQVVIVKRDAGVFAGWIGPDRNPVGQLTAVKGSGGAGLGKPMSGWNRRELAVVFADRPTPEGHWEIRVGRARAGSIPESTVVVPLPKGGPGGDAFAPDIAGLPDGRWLLMWTEGPAGNRAIRAQTLGVDLTPIGDPIALSPPAGNFGQGVLGVVNDYAAAVFLQKGRASYELWGAILQCGS
jgi:hypothetical protein